MVPWPLGHDPETPGAGRRGAAFHPATLPYWHTSDPLYGFDLGAWPETFVDYVALELACKTCKRITGKDSLLQGPDGLLKQRDKAKREAMGNDAQNDPIKFPPQGSWVSSRRGYRVGRGAKR